MAKAGRIFQTGLSGLGPLAGIVIGQERHRGDLARAAAGLAVGLEQGFDAFVELGRGVHQSGAGEEEQNYVT